ncbi:MlaD family protein [Mycolicibacterium sphagni]|uniref:MlaD family protein n=1 Tax=Mycolicibacterium sphagni TaxID=1786 RepID=UPI0021F2670D|nr:MlaD family protein [Mycolicibacterium sphagni]MCV7177410.1 MCE family protein [Mycolicibacterium sphagni]
MIDKAADRLVRVVGFGHRHRLWLSTAGLVLTLVIATAYVLLGALRVSPFASAYQVTIQLPESGGLLPNQDVTLRGVPIGRVQSLAITPDGVAAVATVRSDVRIPVASPVRVSGLSPAGEQYIEFVPDSDAGPYLQDGSVVAQNKTSVPVSLAQLLANADGMLKQVDPAKLELIKKELSLTNQGPQKLADIIDGGTFLLSTLDSVLPETTSILRTSRIVLTTAADKTPGIAVATGNLSRTFTGVDKMLGGYRQFVDQTPQTLSATDNLFTDNSDTMVRLLTSMATASQLLYVRVPALNALFPDYRGSLLDAWATTMHDHGLWATADIYPRYACDYGTPRRAASSADYPEPYLYTYCRDDDPAVLIRGAKNAPRPAGDDTAGPPPGADLGQTTDPTPKGRYTIPTPYGGPVLPIEPPS